jgi:hypothetical protein
MGSHLWVMHSHVNRVRVLDRNVKNMTKLVPRVASDGVGDRSAPLRAHAARAVFEIHCHALNSNHLAISQRGSFFFRVPLCRFGHCAWCTTKGGQGTVLPSREDDAS